MTSMHADVTIVRDRLVVQSSMGDGATTELGHLVQRAREILDEIASRGVKDGPSRVEQLLELRTEIERRLDGSDGQDGRDLVSDLDEHIRRLCHALVALAGGSFESMRDKRAGQHLDWWWRLDRLDSSPVGWATRGPCPMARGAIDQVPALRLGPRADTREGRLTLPLMKNTQFIYELNLARLELSILNGDPEVEVLSDLECLRTRHNPGREDLLRRRLAYFSVVRSDPTVYQEVRTYTVSRSVNQYLTHWFYPYKGKFHPQVIRALLNILRLAPGARVLDPFCGVGTAALECMLLGIDSVNVDISHVATRVARAKVESWRALEEIAEQLPCRLEHPPIYPDDDNRRLPLEGYGPDEPSAAGAVANFFVVAALIASSDTGRRRRDFLGAYQDRCRKMLESARLLRRCVSDLRLSVGRVDISRADARELPLDDHSVDGIITSPPYSIALNYVENDRHALHALGLSLDGVKDEYIGVRGAGAEKILAYESDMKLAVREMARVLKPGGRCAVIIGNPTHLAEPVDAESLLDQLCQSQGLQIWHDEGVDLSHSIPKYVYGLYNVIQKEQILLFTKPGREARLLPP